jgi:signal peptidase I
VATNTEAAHAQAHLFEKTRTADSQEERSFRERSVVEVTDAIQNRGWAFLKVSGKSMFPWIREDDIVFLRRVGMQDVAPGDVVVFERNSTLCVHRVLSVNADATAPGSGGALITKGDATADADAPVFRDEFRGKVEFVYRRKREIRVARGWRKYFGKFLAIISPAVSLWRPIAAMGRDAARCELRGVPHFKVRRSFESSAD